jgi:hypothetical protein
MLAMLPYSNMRYLFMHNQNFHYSVWRKGVKIWYKQFVWNFLFFQLELSIIMLINLVKTQIRIRNCPIYYNHFFFRRIKSVKSIHFFHFLHLDLICKIKILFATWRLQHNGSEWVSCMECLFIFYLETKNLGCVSWRVLSLKFVLR